MPVSGTVAAGMALSGATLNILDATGKSMASNATVPPSGNFGPITLTGSGPYRLAACGYAGDRYTCLFSVTQLGGTAHITPLTSAIVMLASGAVPASPMSGASTALSAAAVAAAQSQLQAAIAPALADAGMASNADLITSALSAGSRTGHDRLLDNLGVTLGQDAAPFVQIEPRLGSGSVTLSPTGSTGQLSIAPGAASVNLGGIGALFSSLTAAMASANACAAGMDPLMAANARMSVSGITFAGVNVSTALCNLIGNGLFSDGTFPYGIKLVSPQLGRCDFSGVSGASAVCRVGLVAQTPKGALLTFAQNQAVAWQGGGWLFMGDMQPFPASAEARAQRLRRVDGGNQVDSYLRSIGITVSALSGAQCAKVTQADAAGADVTLAYLKAGPSARNLSVWNVDAANNQVSLEPATGALRSIDDIWIPLPDGTAGDATVRNFNAGGQAVKVALFGDAACTAPLTPAGGTSVFTLDLAAVPPLTAALPALPWPSLASAATTSLAGLKGAASAKLNFSGAWTLPSPPPSLSTAQLCVDSLCNPTALIGTLAVTPGATSGAIAATVGLLALGVDDFKQLRLSARSADGLLMTGDFQSCSSATAGAVCQVSAPLRQALGARTGKR